MAYARHTAASLRNILQDLDKTRASISALIEQMESHGIAELSINYKAEVRRGLIRLWDFASDGERQVRRWLDENGHFTADDETPES